MKYKKNWEETKEKFRNYWKHQNTGRPLMIVWAEKEDTPAMKFDPENKWLVKHLELVKKCRELAGDDFYIPIPDLMENIDVLASLRGAQNTVYDLIDEPEEMEERIRQVTDVYFDYYDRFYDLVKDKDGSSSYTVFQIWGEGKTAKLQCDFSALMSPNQFREFIVDSLRQQAGKSLWIKVYSGNVDDWIRNVDRLVQRYGSHSMLLYFNPMPMADAKKLMAYAEEHWKDVKGTF